MTTNATEVLAAAPAAVSSLLSVASAVETSVAQHQTIAQTTTTALNATLASLSSPAVTAAIGSNDAANVATGITLAQEAETLASGISGFITAIESFFKKL